jgi:hypothetical protein
MVGVVEDRLTNTPRSGVKDLNFGVILENKLKGYICRRRQLFSEYRNQEANSLGSSNQGQGQ